MSMKMRDLIKAIHSLRVQVQEAEKHEDAISARPDRPALPSVRAKEFLPCFYPHKRQEFFQPDVIDQAIDEYIEGRRHQYRMLMPPELRETMFLTPEFEARLIQDTEKAEETRQRVQALWAERNRFHYEWAEASGYAEAVEKTRALSEAHDNLENELLDTPATTLAELATKAAYIQAEYGADYVLERQQDFIREVASFVPAHVGAAIGELKKAK